MFNGVMGLHQRYSPRCKWTVGRCLYLDSFLVDEPVEITFTRKKTCFFQQANQKEMLLDEKAAS